jgi:hypothetical protein
MNSLIEQLKKIKDVRRSQGRRHPLWLILLVVILGLMMGQLEYRALGDFAKFQQRLFTKHLAIPNYQPPSYSTIRRVMMGVNWLDLIQVFNSWASQLAPLDEESSWLAIDGKSLKSTVEHYFHNHQNFISIISVFCQDNGLVLHLDRIENKHKSEIHQVHDIAMTSGLSNRVFTLDALHCQKKLLI